MISVVVPCHVTAENSPRIGEQLWYTISTAIASLEASKIDFEILAVMNGEYPMAAAFMHVRQGISPLYAGRAVESPQAARHLGFLRSRSDTIFFLDSHVLIPPNFFAQILADMEETGADFMGTGHRFMGQTWHGCHVAWSDFLWHRYSYADALSPNPYRVALHPHGAFAIRRRAYERSGGYWLALKGWGGEEPQLCFKLWMTGHTCWLTPRTYHWHWLAPGARRDGSCFTREQFARNFHLIAAAYGNRKDVERVHKSFQILHWRNEDRFPEMVDEVLQCAEVQKEKEMLAKFGKVQTLADLRLKFDIEGIIN